VLILIIPSGTSLFGGVGTVIGMIVGALDRLINNGLIQMPQEFIARGGIIILAVALSQSAQ
jgi:ribose transport system permease protein